MPHLDLTPLQAWCGLGSIAFLLTFYVGFKAGQENENAKWCKELDRKRRLARDG